MKEIKDILDPENIKSFVPGNYRWFDVLYVSGQSTPISFKNNRLHSINQSQSSGIGVRINRDGKTGFSYTNNLQHVKETFIRAYEISRYCEEEGFDLPGDTKVLFEPFNPEIDNFDPLMEIEQAREFIASMEKDFNDISIDIGINAAKGLVHLVNSNGLSLSYRDSYYSASISTTLILDKGVRLDLWDSKSELRPVRWDELRLKLTDKIKRAITIEKISSGLYPVIFPPQAFGSLLGIVLSGLNGVAIWKGISPFCGKIGEKLFANRLTVYDDPFIEGSPFQIPFDAEGLSVSRKKLINEGVVERFITDLKYGERLGVGSTGNASRGYSSIPSPSFNGIVVEPGDEPFESLIKGIKRGIIAEQFIGLGQSNTLLGDFSANLDLAYLVEDGEIKGRVKDCMISGNIIDLLKGEFYLSSDRERKGSSLLTYAMFPAINIVA
jgi:PmbA protein